MLKSHQTGFYDLNIQESCFQNGGSQEVLKHLYALGYRTIAINQTIDTDASKDTKKKKKKGEPRDVIDIVPVPFNIEELKKIALDLKLENLTIFNRLTLIFSNQDSIQKYIRANNYKKYDIVAVIPTTMTGLGFVCSTMEADILGFDPENRMNVRLNRKMYSQLILRKYHLELTYSPAIEDATKRKNLIHLSHLYHTFGKSRNIIFSSGAERIMFIRGPYDIISLGFLFGLNELQSKNAVLHCARNVTVHALGRRQGKAVILMEDVETMELSDTVDFVSDNDDIEMETDEPVQKKSKQ